jgi:hypothetical protein
MTWVLGLAALAPTANSSPTPIVPNGPKQAQPDRLLPELRYKRSIPDGIQVGRGKARQDAARTRHRFRRCRPNFCQAGSDLAR